jgi:hypothetical protein
MKKVFLYILTVFLFGTAGLAQRGTYTVKTTPSSFTVEDSITLEVDLTNSPDMAGKDEVYIWIFANGSINGDVNADAEWTNSKEKAKMTKIGPNKFRFGFIPLTMWPNIAPADLKEFAFLVKVKDGSKQTDNSARFPIDPLTFTEATYLSFPDKVGEDDVITIYFNQLLATDVTEQRMTPSTITINAISQTDVPVGTPLTGTLVNEGNKRYSFTFIPTRSFGRTPGGIKKLTYRINGFGKDVSGNTIPVTGMMQEKLLSNLK